MCFANPENEISTEPKRRLLIMKNKKKKLTRLFFPIFLFCFISPISVTFGTNDSINPIIVPNDYFSQNNEEWKKNIIIKNELLTKLLPELTTPLIFSADNLDDARDNILFNKKRHKFIISGNFNNDNYFDIAFIGQSNNSNPKFKNIFLSIFSIRGEIIQREMLLKFKRKKAFFITSDNVKAKKEIIVSFTFGSDDCGYIRWVGKEYQFSLCTSVFGKD
jgi:hypothetical protein